MWSRATFTVCKSFRPTWGLFSWNRFFGDAGNRFLVFATCFSSTCNGLPGILAKCFFGHSARHFPEVLLQRVSRCARNKGCPECKQLSWNSRSSFQGLLATGFREVTATSLRRSSQRFMKVLATSFQGTHIRFFGEGTLRKSLTDTSNEFPEVPRENFSYNNFWCILDGFSKDFFLGYWLGCVHNEPPVDETNFLKY